MLHTITAGITDINDIIEDIRFDGEACAISTASTSIMTELVKGKSVEEAKATMPEELKTYKDEDAEVVEGIFDGYYMVGADQKKYPVPMNYSSKSKLVPGDVMKLKILPEGKLVFKLIKPAERKHLKAILSKTDDNKFTANTDDGKVYFLNQAAVSFHAGKPGDELYIIVNDKDEGMFAAIEAIIKK